MEEPQRRKPANLLRRKGIFFVSGIPPAEQRYRTGLGLFAVIFFLYMVNYASRNTLSATITPIMEELGCTKSDLSVVTTGYFLVYGVMQLVSGALADRIPSQYLISGGIAASSLMLLGMGLSHDLVSMTVFWTLNGACQALLFPPSISTLVECMPKAQKLKSSVYFGISSPTGALLLFLLSAAVLSFTGWRPLFFICSALLMATAVAVFPLLTRLKRSLRESAGLDEADGPVSAPDADPGKPAERISFFQMMTLSGAWALAFTYFLVGILREGLMTWAPTFLVERFWLDSSRASLLSTLMPILNIASNFVVLPILKRCGGSETRAISLIFFGSVLSTSALLFFPDCGSWTAMGLVAFTTASQVASGAIMAATSNHFSRFRKTAAYMGFLNFCAFMGTSLASYLFGTLAERSGGWDLPILCWVIVTVLGTVVPLLLGGRWHRFKQQQSH